MTKKVNKKTAKRQVSKKTTDWRDVVVHDLSKAVKLLGVDARDYLSFSYPYRVTPSIGSVNFVHDKELWKKLERKFPKLSCLSPNDSTNISVTYPMNGKSKISIIEIGKVRCRSKKPSQLALELLSEDAKASKAEDDNLLSKGFKKPTRDIVKDDCCYGCKEACEHQSDDMGPFDRRFKCNGIIRIYAELKRAIDALNLLSAYNPNARLSQPGYMKGDQVLDALLRAQDAAIRAVALLCERVRDNRIECLETKGRPDCYMKVSDTHG